MQKLTIVVNCTDRKSVVPAPHLQVRSLPPGGTAERFASWRQRVQQPGPKVPLHRLYQGEAWLQAKSLADDARARGTSVRMLVASAGLGLQDVTRQAPAYAATFASGHADSVTEHPKAMADWWQRLGELPHAESLRDASEGPVLLVLSENYARAMDADLVGLSTRGGDYFLVGGWRTIDGLPRLPADRNLRQTLGGTVSSVSLRMARRWMAQRSGLGLFTAADATRWDDWARTAREAESYERTPMSDEALRVRIRELLLAESGLSASRALRALRERGIACEQKRFGALFREVASVR